MNNSRETVTCDCEWQLELGDSGVKAAPVPFEIGGRTKINVSTGQQERVPIAFELTRATGPSTFRLKARVSFGTGEIQDDSFAIHVLPGATAPRADTKIALFDPPGETRKLLSDLSIVFTSIDTGTDLSEYDTLIVGKGALTLPGPAPSIARVRNGLKVIVFEQTAAVLEKRLGFRVAEYGLRQVFPRVGDHPILSARALSICVTGEAPARSVRPIWSMSYGLVTVRQFAGATFPFRACGAVEIRAMSRRC